MRNRISRLNVGDGDTARLYPRHMLNAITVAVIQYNARDDVENFYDKRGGKRQENRGCCVPGRLASRPQNFVPRNLAGPCSGEFRLLVKSLYETLLDSRLAAHFAYK